MNVIKYRRCLEEICKECNQGKVMLSNLYVTRVSSDNLCNKESPLLLVGNK